MGLRSLCSTIPLLVLSLAVRVNAQGPGAEDDPLLRLEAGGPTTLVTSLAFGPDGQTLYEAGWDKVVRVWDRDAAIGAFVADEPATYRVPIGPGTDGAINALAVSDDGTWLAVAGYGVARGSAGFRQTGNVVPMSAITDEMRRDLGTIHVFDTRAEPRTARVLRGHLGPVYALVFAPSREGKPPLLVSAGREREEGTSIRLWDVDAGEYLGGSLGPREAAGEPGASAMRSRPGLAIWHSGPDRTDIGVAVAWGDGPLRLWGPGRDGGRGTSSRTPDGIANNTVAFLPDRAMLLTGSLNLDPQRGPLDGHGLVRSWTFAAGGGLQQDDRLLVSFAPEGRQVEVPQALAVFPSRPGGPADRAAVVLRRLPEQGSGGRGSYSLALVALEPDGFRVVGPRLTLWPDVGIMPALAVDPTGRSLAIAGNRDREVHLYAVADLLAGDAAPQRLRGAGEVVRHVAFVRKGPDWGLRIDGEGADPGDTAPGGLILDVAARRLSGKTDGWAVSAPDPGPWGATVVPPRSPGADPWSVAVRSDGQEAGRIVLEPDQAVTATALFPPGPEAGDGPIVAVAFQERGEPALGLYHGTTGALIRRLTGHAERITSLAFSGDGRLLASAAEDRTVSVWSLTDLDESRDTLHLPPGILFLDRDGRLVVGGIDPGHPAAVDGSLREGDAILGFLEPGALRPTRSWQELRDALAAVEPGQSVTFRRAREGGDVRDVPLRIVRRADERKPLFSLFVTREGADDGEAGPGWVGWSPLGPFETSDRGVERWLGWHFNTADPRAPARFSRLDQYRDRFYREGLLADLMERGALVPPAPPEPLPRPEMGLILDPQGEVDDRGMILLRQSPTALGMTASGPRLTDDLVDSVLWQVDGSPPQELDDDGEGAWSATIAGPPWERGIHRVRAVLRTGEAVPQEFVEERLVRVQPPAPVIVVEESGPSPAVDEPTYRFRAQVRPIGGPAVMSLVRRTDRGDQVEKTWDPIAEPLQVDEPLELAEGANTFTLVARNEGALAGFEDAETARAARTVVYTRKPVPPPEIALSAATPLPGDPTAESAEIPLDGPGPLVVTEPRLRIVGRIAGAEPLSRAESLDGEDAGAQVLDGFEPGRVTEFAIDQVLDLEPGPRTYRFRAQAADSELAEVPLTIDFRPQVPRVLDLALDPSGPVVYADPGQPPPMVRLTATLGPRTDRRPFEATILVNEREQPDPGTVDDEAGTVTADVALVPGDNQIRVRLHNEWGAIYTSEATHVRYLRPPVVTAIRPPEVGDEALIRVVATVESPDGLPVDRAQIEVEDGSGEPLAVVDRVEIRREGDAWLLTADDVPVAEGENTLRVWAWNRDGRSREPALLPGVAYHRPPPPRPVAEFLRPSQATAVGAGEVSVLFQVRSSSPLRRVELLREEVAGGSEVIFASDEIPQDGQGLYVVTAEPTVPLRPGANYLRLVALNAGGSADDRLVVSYTPPPVAVIVEGIEPRDGTGPRIVPATLGDNQFVFTEPVPSGTAWLVGRIEWPDRDALERHGTSRINVWVNGFPQTQATLVDRPDRPLERGFRVPILLNHEQNLIEIELPDLPREAGDRPEFALGCLEPDTRQRLHLLLIGVGEPEEPLRDRAVRSLQGELVEGTTDRFSTPAFPEGIIYGPCCGDVRAYHVNGALLRISQVIRRRRNAPDAPNEVVLIYYQGREWSVDARSTHLRLGDGQGRGTFDTIPITAMVAILKETPAVKIFLLDVTREAEATPSPIDPRIGLLRSAWIQAEDAPPDRAETAAAWLFTSLEDVTARARTLGDVASAIERDFQARRVEFPNLQFQSDFPSALSSLVIGTR